MNIKAMIQGWPCLKVAADVDAVMTGFNTTRFFKQTIIKLFDLCRKLGVRRSIAWHEGRHTSAFLKELSTSKILNVLLGKNNLAHFVTNKQSNN